jgi:twitching motility protein PilT
MYGRTAGPLRRRLGAETTKRKDNEKMIELHRMIHDASLKKASDIFIKSGAVPMMRQHGRITKLGDYPMLTPDDTRKLAYSVMTHEQIGRFEHRHELDLAFEVEGIVRVRCNVYQQRGSMGLVCRLVPLKIFTLEDLGLPKVWANWSSTGRA